MGLCFLRTASFPNLLLVFLYLTSISIIRTKAQTPTTLAQRLTQRQSQSPRRTQSETNPDFETNAQEDRFSDLSITVDKGGCRLDCYLTRKQPKYYDGWFDSTRLNLKARSLSGKAMILANFFPEDPALASKNSAGSQCPAKLSPVSNPPTRGFVLLLVLPPAYQNCSLITLSHLAKQANAEALLVSQRCLWSLESHGEQQQGCREFEKLYNAEATAFIQKDLGVPEIPVVLLSRTDGNRYTSCLRAKTCVEGTELLASLDWTRPEASFEWAFWEPPQDVATRTQKPVVLDNRFYDVVLPKLLHVQFDPLYALVKDDPICKSNAQECVERCRATLDPGTNNLVHFCLPGFTGGAAEVNVTLDEFARRWYIHANSKLVKPRLWWEYNKLFFNECSDDLAVCSRRILKELGEDADKIFQRAKRNSFGAWDYYADKYEVAQIGKTVGVITANQKIIYKEVTDANTNFIALMSQLCALVGPGSPEQLLGRECVCAASGTVYGTVEEFKECANVQTSTNPPLPVITIMAIAIACSFVVFAILMFAFRIYDRRQRRSRLDSELKDVLLRYLPDSDMSQRAEQGAPRTQGDNYTIVDTAAQQTSTDAGLNGSSNGVQMSSVSTASSTTESRTSQSEQAAGTHPLDQNLSHFQLQNT